MGSMKHVVLTPKGTTYLTVYVEDKQLLLRLPSGYAMHLDAKVIPQLLGILHEIEKEIQ